MNTNNYLKLLVEKIHTSIVATVDEKGLPVTCAIDIMDYDETSLYFLTAKGKSFYKRLKDNKFLALTALKGESTLSSIALSIRGDVVEIGQATLLSLFDKNPYMHDIYPTENARNALTVFRISNIEGEFFDLSQKPIFRESFTYSDDNHSNVHKHKKYIITDRCNTCKICLEHCPVECITISQTFAKITESNCLHCGNCANICPQKAVIYE